MTDDSSQLITKVSDLTFNKLLDEVNPVSSASRAVNKDDLSLINLSKSAEAIEIIFDRDAEKSPIVSFDKSIDEAFNWSPTSNSTKFNCILFGCHWLLFRCNLEQVLTQYKQRNINNNGNEHKDEYKDDTNVTTTGVVVNESNEEPAPLTLTTPSPLLQHICAMIEKWFDNSSSNIVKEEITSIWSILEQLILFDNFTFDSDNSNDASFISLRLALILFGEAKIISKFSFVNETTDDDILSFKSKIDNSMFKEMVLQIGSFVDIYDTMTQSVSGGGDTSKSQNRGDVICLFVF